MATGTGGEAGWGTDEKQAALMHSWMMGQLGERVETEEWDPSQSL